MARAVIRALQRPSSENIHDMLSAKKKFSNVFVRSKFRWLGRQKNKALQDALTKAVRETRYPGLLKQSFEILQLMVHSSDFSEPEGSAVALLTMLAKDKKLPEFKRQWARLTLIAAARASRPSHFSTQLKTLDGARLHRHLPRRLVISALAETERCDLASAYLRDTIEKRSGHKTLNAGAWDILRCKKSSLSLNRLALWWAEAAARKSGWKVPHILDTLALAYVRIGDHKRALDIRLLAFRRGQAGHSDYPEIAILRGDTPGGHRLPASSKGGPK
jgi:hypothetical protein